MTEPGITYQLFVNTFEQYGIFSILPFFLIFSIVFLILESFNAFKRSKDDYTGTKLHAGFALGFSLMCIAHKPLIDWLFNLLPQGAMVLVAGLMLLMVMSLLAGGTEMSAGMRVFTFIILVIVMIIIGASSFFGGGVKRSGFDLRSILTPELVTILVMIGVFISLIWWFTKPVEEEND